MVLWFQVNVRLKNSVETVRLELDLYCIILNQTKLTMYDRLQAACTQRERSGAPPPLPWVAVDTVSYGRS